MFLTALRGVLAHKLRLLATALAVTLGVAFMAGTLVLTDTVTRTFDDLFGDVNKNTDVVVRGVAAFEGLQGSGAQRPRLEQGLVRAVRAVPGVAKVEGDVFGYARIVGKDGKALGNPANGAPTIGLNWGTVPELNPFVLTSGRPPVAPDEVVIDAKSAREAGFAVGDTATILVQGPPLKARVVGIARFGSADSPGGATVAAFETVTAQRLVAEPGRFDSLAIVGSHGLAQEDLAQQVAAVLPSGVEAVTGATVTQENQDDIHRSLGFFTTFMLVFAGVALFVGAFMIFNTFSITVAQRTQENGLLRALGASRRQVLAAVLVEALAVGVTASALGLALGVGVAAGLKALLGAVGVDIPAGGIVFLPRTAVLSILVGVGVTLVAAGGPARRASHVSPMAAMHAQTTELGRRASGRRLAVGLGLLAVGGAALMTGLNADVDHRVQLVGGGVIGIFFATSVLGGVISLPLSRVIGWGPARIRGVTGELARENAMRNPRRTAATASALMIGVGLVGFITIFVASSKASVSDVIAKSFSADLVLDSGAGANAGAAGGVDPALAERVNLLPQVQAATGVRIGGAQVKGKVVQLWGVDPATAFKILDVDPAAGSPANLGEDGIAVHADVAAAQGLSVGDRLPVLFRDTGTVRLKVGMIYREREPVGDYLLGKAAYDANFVNRYDWQVWIKQSPGSGQAETRAAIERVAAAYPGVDVLTRSEFETRILQPLNQLLALVYALLALAILIALLGIANTLALSVYERTREIGLLRAIGMTRGQLRAAIRWESVIISVQGTVLGLVLGVVFAWSLVRVLGDEGITVFRVPYGSLGVIVVLAALAGVAAAMGPSRRASRMNVLRAMATD
jgi:putative ABC transport system permease protein